MEKETALKILRDLHNKALFSERTALETLIPELKESEDEKIRKEIIYYLCEREIIELPTETRIKKDWISWLEKQGAQKPTDKPEPKFKVGDWVIQENIGVYKIIEICESWYEVTDLEDNHFSISFDNEYMCHLWTMKEAGYEGNAEKKDLKIIDWSKHIKYNPNGPSIIEEKSTWSEEDEKMFSGIISIVEEWYNAMTEVEKEYYGDCGYINWLESLKDRVQPQPISNEYVDLGLPSGTLWKSSNETSPDHNFYTYDEAMEKFGDQLPTKEQWKELKDRCVWTWTDKGHNVTGPNGNSIFLPAVGYSDLDGNVYDVGSDGDYWSSTPNSSTFAYSLGFDWSEIFMYSVMRSYRQSVRLVK